MGNLIGRIPNIHKLTEGWVIDFTDGRPERARGEKITDMLLEKSVNCLRQTGLSDPIPVPRGPTIWADSTRIPIDWRRKTRQLAPIFLRQYLAQSNSAGALGSIGILEFRQESP